MQLCNYTTMQPHLYNPTLHPGTHCQLQHCPMDAFYAVPGQNKIHLGYGNTNLHNAVTNRGEGMSFIIILKTGGTNLLAGVRGLISAL